MMRSGYFFDLKRYVVGLFVVVVYPLGDDSFLASALVGDDHEGKVVFLGLFEPFLDEDEVFFKALGGLFRVILEDNVGNTY